jgi:hypothetical protein
VVDDLDITEEKKEEEKRPSTGKRITKLSFHDYYAYWRKMATSTDHSLISLRFRKGKIEKRFLSLVNDPHALKAELFKSKENLLARQSIKPHELIPKAPPKTVPLDLEPTVRPMRTAIQPWEQEANELIEWTNNLHV